VPYLNPNLTGTVAGIIGAGNLGVTRDHFLVYLRLISLILSVFQGVMQGRSLFQLCFAKLITAPHFCIWELLQRAPRCYQILYESWDTKAYFSRDACLQVHLIAARDPNPTSLNSHLM
jgi:nitrate/nitrite transporter NarK